MMRRGFWAAKLRKSKRQNNPAMNIITSVESNITMCVIWGIMLSFYAARHIKLIAKQRVMLYMSIMIFVVNFIEILGKI